MTSAEWFVEWVRRRSREHKPGAVVVLGAVIAGERSTRAIAAAVGYSPRQVRRYVAGLERVGVVVVRRSGRRVRVAFVGDERPELLDRCRSSLSPVLDAGRTGGNSGA